MSHAEPRAIPWRRLGAESAAILLSILLAFAIDAWWGLREERVRAADLSRALAADFEASRPLLEERITLAERMVNGNALLLSLLESASGSSVAVPDSLILAVIGGPTYEPSTSTLDAAVASGEIDLLKDPGLRVELATWRRLLADTAEDELEVRRITNQEIVPLLARSVGLGPYFGRLLAWTGGDVFGSGIVATVRGGGAADGHAEIVASTELQGALALRKFYLDFAAADLVSLRSSLDRVAALLEE